MNNSNCTKEVNWANLFIIVAVILLIAIIYNRLEQNFHQRRVGDPSLLIDVDKVRGEMPLMDSSILLGK